jgi:hypothetical protein
MRVLWSTIPINIQGQKPRCSAGIAAKITNNTNRHGLMNEPALFLVAILAIKPNKQTPFISLKFQTELA